MMLHHLLLDPVLMKLLLVMVVSVRMLSLTAEAVYVMVLSGRYWLLLMAAGVLIGCLVAVGRGLVMGDRLVGRGLLVSGRLVGCLLLVDLVSLLHVVHLSWVMWAELATGTWAWLWVD
jgi:hypothetical protein